MIEVDNSKHCNDFFSSFLFGFNTGCTFSGGRTVSPISMVIASIAVLGVLMLSFGYLYISERKSYILIWLISLSGLLLTYLSRMIIIVSGQEGTLLLIINYASFISGLWFIYKGTGIFFEKRVNPLYAILAALLIFTYALLLMIKIPATVVLLLSPAYSAVVLTITGCTCLSALKIKNSIKNILGYAFFIWAASTLIYPFCKMLKIVPLQYAYFSVGLTGLVAIICILAAYFQSVREEMLANEEKIKNLVLYDKLTGVYNRAYFEEITSDFFDRFNLPIVLAMGDINGLKLINDTFGHKQGDKLLVAAVTIMKESIGGNNFIVRLGGDEFIIIMPQTTMAEAEKLVEVIKLNCRSFCSDTIPVDISLGISVVENRECRVEDILEQAEERMYRSKLDESKQTRTDIINFLQKLLWEKDYQTEEHVTRLKSLASTVGKKIGLSPKENDELIQVALLHDIGKIAVPVEILNKPGSLTPVEWEIMKKHSETGYRIAQSSRELAHISEAILGHHEWWNGSGYPQGLKGKEIPLYSRIVTIVDSFDVMTHERPYKHAVNTIDALLEIKRCAGIQYDPYLADIFINLMRK
jgi:diguanylate cyclase (GGDEF)-like protein